MPHPLIRLLRLNQPAGILLLLWPCMWSLMLHAHGNPPLTVLLLFALGAVLMRSCGCIINDLADKEVDAKVARTKTRPIASGEISRRQALLIAALLLMGAAEIALYFGLTFTLWSLAALPLVATYPFMKRITYWPQAFLGLTFNWGAWLGAVAMTGDITLASLFLYIGGIFWTLGYDTIYAYQDAEDDALIGVKSTALKLGAHPQVAIGCFYAIFIFCLSVAGALLIAPAAYFISVGLFALSLMFQITHLDIKSSATCMRLFKLNAWWGWVPAFGVCIIM
jgi:4-hydroxybenzoate polyprenyltransferase